jgi:hypothetical protein
LVELVPALTPGGDQAGFLENIEVLGYRLPTGVDAVFGDEPCAQLEQRLVVPLRELIQDEPSGGISQGSVDVQLPIIGKSSLAYQGVEASDPAARVDPQFARKTDGSLRLEVFLEAERPIYGS